MNIINLARSTVKTIYINLRIFPFFKAVRFPIVASYDVIFEGCRKNCIELLDDTVKFASIKVGFYDGTGHMAKDKNTVISIDRNCTLKVGHDVTIAKGSIIRISSGGVLV
ncbi:MAG: hypothetical protein LUI14_10745 [Lachnospiraceae bacterium]|nr:hypothetical protein [Lachnospiraceae bacterium]